MVSRRDGDVVKEALRASVRLAVGSNSNGSHSFASLPPFPTSIVDDLHKRWQQHTRAGVKEATGNTPLWDNTESTGF
jgi:hypothetical protein